MAKNEKFPISEKYNFYECIDQGVKTINILMTSWEMMLLEGFWPSEFFEFFVLCRIRTQCSSN